MLLKSLLDIVTENAPCSINIQVKKGGIDAVTIKDKVYPPVINKVWLSKEFIQDLSAFPEKELISELRWILEK